jgi:hypothetical protein
LNCRDAREEEGEEALNLKHEIRNEEVFTAKAGEELLDIGD